MRSSMRAARRPHAAPRFPRAICVALALLLIAQAHGAQVTLRVEDGLGETIPARLHVRDGLGQSWPGYADSALMSHSRLGGYFYCPGEVVMDLPPGEADIVVGRGFEWRPATLAPMIHGDTSIVVTLEKPFDMRARGWFSGDTHLHTQHPVEDGGPERDSYPVTPEGARLVGLAEDLAQTWFLDGLYEFTGGPHELSTPELGLYFGAEYMNQVCGHVAMLGQKQWYDSWCCAPPHPVFPLLSHLWDLWTPEWDEALVLLHPQTGGDFFADEGWPERGLGRELPVLAALDRLESVDLAAYSNDPDVFLEDWYRLLNCGLDQACSAGTDALLNAYDARPAGGYRVYVREHPYVTHDCSWWVEALKAGRSFVTNYPLIPNFAVGGVERGEHLPLPTAPVDVPVSFRIESVLPVATATLIRNGEAVVTIDLPGGPAGTVVDTALAMTVDQSCWVALRVDGSTDLRHATDTHLFAHTAPIYVDIAQTPRRSTLDAGYFLDWVDSLWIFVEERDNWTNPLMREWVLEKLDGARAFYREAFVEPPSPAQLLAPAPGDSVEEGAPIQFVWAASQDPEPGDRVTYRFEFSVDDSTFADPLVVEPLEEPTHLMSEPVLEANLRNYWRVFSLDRGGHATLSEPGFCWFVMPGEPARAPEDPQGYAGSAEPTRLSVWPTPATGHVRFRLEGPPSGGCELEILDVCGRTLARLVVREGGEISGDRIGEPTLRREGPGVYAWNGCDPRGRPVGSGCYWLRLRAKAAREHGEGAILRIVKPILMLR